MARKLTAAQAARQKQQRVRKNIAQGIAHISSTFNNTIVTLTDVKGEAISWSSAGQAASRAPRRARRSRRSSLLKLLHAVPKSMV